VGEMSREALNPQIVASGVTRLNRRPRVASKARDPTRQRPDTTASVSAIRSTYRCPVPSGSVGTGAAGSG
jgi:hypothetical protein